MTLVWSWGERAHGHPRHPALGDGVSHLGRTQQHADKAPRRSPAGKRRSQTAGGNGLTWPASSRPAQQPPACCRTRPLRQHERPGAHVPARGARSLPAGQSPGAGCVTRSGCRAHSAARSRALSAAGGTAPASAAWQPHLEEVDLHGAVAEVQDDGAAGPEPRAQVG